MARVNSHINSVYNRENYLGLINSIKRLSHLNTYIFLGMTNSFLHPSFFELLLSYGIRYIRIPTESVIYPNVVNKETSIQETGETAIFICRIID